MNVTTEVARTVFVAWLAAVAGPVIAQQNYPTRPVRYIVPFPPGGSTDPMARMMAAKLTERWGQSVIVDNRPGGNTVIGTQVLAKAKPGQLNFGSSGIGTNTHLSGELFKIMTGVDILHVPYKGSGPLSTDLLGGRIEMSFQVPITVIVMINAEKLKAIAVSGDTRLPALPQVPTFSEAGLPGYGLTSVNGIIAPARTPRQIIGKISSEVAAILAMPDTLEFLARQGAEPFVSTPEETSALIKVELARYAKIIKDAGIKFQP